MAFSPTTRVVHIGIFQGKSRIGSRAAGEFAPAGDAYPVILRVRGRDNPPRKTTTKTAFRAGAPI